MNLKEQFGRLVTIARMVKEKPGEWDVSGLSVELGVSESTIHRDIQVLRKYGEVRKLRGKGYHIDRFDFPLEQFSLEEVLALTISGQLLSQQLGSPISDAVASALSKVNSQLPDELEQAVGKLDERFSLQFPTTRDYSAHGAVFRTLNRAILRHHPIEITYFTMGRQSLNERIVDPYCIAFRRGAWYLIGYCHLRRDIRTFGIHRIRKASILRTEHFRLPEDFSIEEYFGGSWQLISDGPTKRVLIRFDASVAPWILEGIWHPTQRMKKESDGCVLFEAQVSGIFEIKRWVLSYGGAATVLEPQELREAVTTEVLALATRYL